MSEPITNLDDAVAALGALPMPVGPGLALPWAASMGDSDLSMFLDDLVSAAMGRWRSEPDVPDRQVLADIERVCANWRTPGRGLRGDGPEPDGLTRLNAPSQALREDEADEPYASRPLPSRDARCGCGHDGGEHHHVSTACYAQLPREVGQPMRICACETFRPVSAEASAARLARYMAPEGGA